MVLGILYFFFFPFSNGCRSERYATAVLMDKNGVCDEAGQCNGNKVRCQC